MAGVRRAAAVIDVVVPAIDNDLIPPNATVGVLVLILVLVSFSVGTLKDGYLRKVPLPRVPRIQSASHVQHIRDTCYLGQVPRIPTWSDLNRSLAGLGRSVLRPFSPLLV